MGNKEGSTELSRQKIRDTCSYLRVAHTPGLNTRRPLICNLFLLLRYRLGDDVSLRTNKADDFDPTVVMQSGGTTAILPLYSRLTSYVKYS